MLIYGFPPIAAPDARILILGSMPGAESLRVQEYYAYKHNSFWRIMGDLFGAGADMPYQKRVQVLKANGVAVWDVLKACERPTSLDADIRSEEPNDFATFFEGHRHIARIGLNGTKAAQCFKKYALPYAQAGIAIRLPSTSPANRRQSFEIKCMKWRAGLFSE